MHHGCSRNLSAKLRRELFQFIDVLRLADEREGQIANLGEIAIVNLQAFDRFESAREKIQHLASSFIRVTRM